MLTAITTWREGKGPDNSGITPHEVEMNTLPCGAAGAAGQKRMVRASEELYKDVRGSASAGLHKRP